MVMLGSMFSGITESYGEKGLGGMLYASVRAKQDRDLLEEQKRDAAAKAAGASAATTGSTAPANPAAPYSAGDSEVSTTATPYTQPKPKKEAAPDLPPVEQIGRKPTPPTPASALPVGPGTDALGNPNPWVGTTAPVTPPTVADPMTDPMSGLPMPSLPQNNPPTSFNPFELMRKMYSTQPSKLPIPPTGPVPSAFALPTGTGGPGGGGGSYPMVGGKPQPGDMRQGMVYTENGWVKAPLDASVPGASFAPSAIPAPPI